MIKITMDKMQKYRFAIYAKNGNELCHATRGYSSMAEIDRIIAILQSGGYVAEIETANMAVKHGHAVFFTLYAGAEKIAVSNAYVSVGHRRTWQQAQLSASKTIANLGKYLDKVIVFC
jgi:uncharacterized protein YegP (UPF0339 family)